MAKGEQRFRRGGCGHFLKDNKDTWSKWLNDAAAERLAGIAE